MEKSKSFFNETNWRFFKEQHPNKAIVIHGPQGSGKTTMAKKIADEYNGVWIHTFPGNCDYFLKANVPDRKVCILDAVTDTEIVEEFLNNIFSSRALFIFCIQGEPTSLLRGPFIFIDTVSKVVTWEQKEVTNG